MYTQLTLLHYCGYSTVVPFHHTLTLLSLQYQLLSARQSSHDSQSAPAVLLTTTLPNVGDPTHGKHDFVTTTTVTNRKQQQSGRG